MNAIRETSLAFFRNCYIDILLYSRQGAFDASYTAFRLSFSSCILLRNFCISIPYPLGRDVPSPAGDGLISLLYSLVYVLSTCLLTSACLLLRLRTILQPLHYCCTGIYAVAPLPYTASVFIAWFPFSCFTINPPRWTSHSCLVIIPPGDPRSRCS